jgi:hypothetical protein
MSLLGSLIGALVTGSVTYTVGKIFGVKFEWNQFLPSDGSVTVFIATIVGAVIGGCHYDPRLENCQ